MHENLFDLSNLKDIWNQAMNHEEKHETPVILIGGKTGAGKSSLLNSILGKNLFKTGASRPQTKEEKSEVWESTVGGIDLIDVPGFGEAGFNNEYINNILDIAEKKAHIFILVLKCDDRALNPEIEFLQKWQSRKSLKKINIILVVNQIDKMNPVRDWCPEILNLKNPQSDKEKNITNYANFLIEYKEIENIKSKITLVSAGEETTLEKEKYGIVELKNKIYEALPDVAKTIFCENTNLLDKEANRIIKYYCTGVFGAVAANFIPASDALLIAPMQLAMISHLGKLYGMKMDISTITAILSTIGTTLAGRTIAQLAISFMPAIKNIVGPPLAATLTYTMGQTINALFKSGKISPDGKVNIYKEEMEEMLQRFKKQAASENIDNIINEDIKNDE